MTDPCILASESWNPASTWFRWISPITSARVLSLPTVEAVHLLGPELYRQTLLRIVEELRPQVLLTTPPLDFLDEAYGQALRVAGTQLVGWLGMDIIDWTAARLKDLRRRYDRLATPTASLAAREPGITPVPWTLAADSVSVCDPDAPSSDIAIITPHSPEREALARALAAHRHRVACYGPRWAMGDLTRPSRLGLMKAARLVITFEDEPLGMVEAALVGARQLTQRGAARATWLADDVGPPSFSGIEQCLAQLESTAQADPWRAAPGWEYTLPLLLEGLPPSVCPTRPESRASPTLAMLQAAVAHSYEHRGLLHSARAGFLAWRAHRPDDHAALAGLARVALAAEDYDEAIAFADEALACCPPTPHATRDLLLFVPREGPGCGLGRSGAADPRAELQALRLTALVEGARLFDALAVLRTLSEAERRAVHGAFVPNLQSKESLLLDRMLSGEMPLPPGGVGLG